MNKMMITVTDRYINIKCRTDDEIKEALQILENKVYNTQYYTIEF